MGSGEKILSPCIHLCSRGLDGLCLGCYRTIEEIRNWHRYSETEKAKVIRLTLERKQRKEKDDPFAHFA